MILVIFPHVDIRIRRKAMEPQPAALDILTKCTRCIPDDLMSQVHQHPPGREKRVQMPDQWGLLLR